MKESTKSFLSGTGRAVGNMIMAYGRAVRITNVMTAYAQTGEQFHAMLPELSLSQQSRAMTHFAGVVAAVEAMLDDVDDLEKIQTAEQAIADLRLWVI